LQGAGFTVKNHPSLIQELGSIARDSNDPKIMEILNNDSLLSDSIKNFNLPPIAIEKCPDSLSGKLFLWNDFADLVLNDISDHNNMGDLSNPNTT
jgi:hypothetical protein